MYNNGQYEEAIAGFKALNGYKDSEEQVTKCENALKDISYNEAVHLINDGKYIEAYEILVALNGYKDSASKVDEIRPQYNSEKRKNSKVGEYIFFGSYEQDNNSSNGKEDIEWLVLAREGQRILVISRYVLDCKQYHSSKIDVTWAHCSLRKWLNGTFVNDAFSSDEQKMVITTTVFAEKNPSYDTSPGSDTNDKVFLLSLSEVNKYFKTNDERTCSPTKYAVAQGVGYSDKFNAACEIMWWLRSPGQDSRKAVLVVNEGTVISWGDFVDDDFCGVRPALWINLGS